jgi:UrcA family protein
MNTSFTLKTAIALIIASAAAFEPARADGIRVTYSDLDLSRPKDVAQLYARVQRAARLVCRAGPKIGLSKIRRCEEQTVADAVNRIDRPQLAALHRQNGKRPTG